MTPAIDIPAKLLRRCAGREGGARQQQVVTVAQGPLIMMAYGLRAVPPAEQGEYWIHTALGDLSPAEAERTLQRWNGRVGR